MPIEEAGETAKWLVPISHQSEARLPADLLWVRSRRCAGAVVWGGWHQLRLAPLSAEA